VLDIVEREKLVERAAAMGTLLRGRLARLEKHPHVAQVRGLGLLHRIRHSSAWGVASRFAPPQLRRFARGLAVKHVPRHEVPTEDVKAYLSPFQADETRALEELLGQSFADWQL